MQLDPGERVQADHPEEGRVVELLEGGAAERLAQRQQFVQTNAGAEDIGSLVDAAISLDLLR